jgi:hypothetical protein
MNSQCDCKNHKSSARILTLDGKEVAAGLLKLSVDGSDGWFEPNSESLIRNVANEHTHPDLLADLKTHQHRLRNWKRLVGGDGCPSLTAGPFGEVIANHRFYFDVIQQ